jgi:hypothetical protein
MKRFELTILDFSCVIQQGFVSTYPFLKPRIVRIKKDNEANGTMEQFDNERMPGKGNF